MIRLTKLEDFKDFCLLTIISPKLDVEELNSALSLAQKAGYQQIIFELSQIEKCSADEFEKLKVFLYERQQFLAATGGSIKVINTNPHNGIKLSILRQAGIQAYHNIDFQEK